MIAVDSNKTLLQHYLSYTVAQNRSGISSSQEEMLRRSFVTVRALRSGSYASLQDSAVLLEPSSGQVA